MSLKDQVFTLLIFLAGIHLFGSIIIELRERAKPKHGHYTGQERRNVRKLAELEPLGESILKETEEMLDNDKLATRDGLKFIIKMMGELYMSDVRRTLKVNEIVEQINLIQNKSVVAWIEARPKLALFLSLVIMSLIVPEIRDPILHYALSQIGVTMP